MFHSFRQPTKQMKSPTNEIFSTDIETFFRSNQDTCLNQRPSVKQGQWVTKGQVLTDCINSVEGDLSLGKNALVAYMPWEGYNFEDSIVISERLIADDVYTSVHVLRFRTEIVNSSVLSTGASPSFPLPSPEIRYPSKGSRIGFAGEADGAVADGVGPLLAQLAQQAKLTVPHTLLKVRGKKGVSQLGQQTKLTPSGYKRRGSKAGFASFAREAQGNKLTSGKRAFANNLSGFPAGNQAAVAPKGHGLLVNSATSPLRSLSFPAGSLSHSLLASLSVPLVKRLAQLRAHPGAQPREQMYQVKGTPRTKNIKAQTELKTHAGNEKRTPNVPFLGSHLLSHLDENGIVKVGTWVSPGDILVGKVTTFLRPQEGKRLKSNRASTQLAWEILSNKRGESTNLEDKSFRLPKGVFGRVIRTDIIPSQSQPVRLPPQSPLASLLLSSASTAKLKKVENPGAKFSSRGEKSDERANTRIFHNSFSGPTLLNFATACSHSCNGAGGAHPERKGAAEQQGRMGKRSSKQGSPGKQNTPATASAQEQIHVYLAVKRKIRIGDKLAGRHGNKGIVSLVLPQEDMPYLPDGTPIDIILSPLGVPSRMNVGQIYECLLGLAARSLVCNFQLDNVLPSVAQQPLGLLVQRRSQYNTARNLVFLKLYHSRMACEARWLFNPYNPGKIRLFDGRTGQPFASWVTVGYAYMLKLIHLVDNKMHSRSTGPYSFLTRQPVTGKARLGGQRIGEMEAWALEGFGAAYTLQEFFSFKGDDVSSRHQWKIASLSTMVGNTTAFKTLLTELKALCISFDFQGYIE